MTDFRLTDAGDLAIENNQLVLISKTEEVAQLLRERLRTFRGEWFLDASIGVPYFEQILKKNPQPAIIQTVLIDEILQTPGVIKILSFDLDINESTRELTTTGSILSTDGDVIPFSEVLA